MSDIAIKVKNISKKYTIGAKASGSLRETLVQKWHSLSKKNDNKEQEFWALKDISFEVKQGEVLGIIGKNGAGKSTLLKILSRITEPTAGRVEIFGRVSSLLEVGTGFHPELTGRENIFLNGTILGMSRKEVKSKFDEIVDFSGVEKFIDTPVKHYSSGMYVRLAFAVAAHLEPEILIIDEVLAVGDAEFQKKCLGKMKDVAGQGRTVLFVSHNMTVVNSFCTNGIYLKQGLINSYGEIQPVVCIYVRNENENKIIRTWQENNRPGDSIAQLITAKIINEKEDVLETIGMSDQIGIELEYTILKSGYKPIPNIHFYTIEGTCVFVAHANQKFCPTKIGLYRAILWIPKDLLNNKSYIIGIALTTMNPVRIHFYEKEALIFDVIEDIKCRTFDGVHSIPGIIRPYLTWKITTVR